MSDRLPSRGDWLPIETAPRDGTEILVRDKDGHRAIVAFAAKGNLTGVNSWIEVDDDGWFRRAGGEWDLYDSFALQEEYPVEWILLP